MSLRFIHSSIHSLSVSMISKWPVKGLCLHNTENWQGTQWYKLPAEQEYLLAFCKQVLSGSLLLGSPNTDTDSGSITSHCKTPCFSLFSQGGAKTRHNRGAKIKLITDPSSNLKLSLSAPALILSFQNLQLWLILPGIPSNFKKVSSVWLLCGHWFYVYIRMYNIFVSIEEQSLKL